MDLEFEDEIISRIAISKDEKFVDTHDVPPSAPISLCDQFRCMHVCIYLKGRLFPEASPCLDTVVVREALVCNSPIEMQYYKSTLVSFPGICYYCGMGAETLIDDSEIQELRESCATVLPICFSARVKAKRLFAGNLLIYPKDQEKRSD